MLAYDYPLLEAFLSILYFALFVVWIWIHDLGGFAKALWFLFIVVVPYLGIFIYLIARGGKMQEHRLAQAKAAQEQFDQLVKSSAGADTATQLEQLAALRDSGVLSAQEFDAQKAKLLA
jgi:hypothetical protein